MVDQATLDLPRHLWSMSPVLYCPSVDGGFTPPSAPALPA